MWIFVRNMNLLGRETLACVSMNPLTLCLVQYYARRENRVAHNSEQGKLLQTTWCSYTGEASTDFLVQLLR